jgi:hypothetical protein
MADRARQPEGLAGPLSVAEKIDIRTPAAVV